MKKIVSGNELYNYMSKAVNMLADIVKVTLGPQGNNVIIDHSTFSPFITNDGVTIASNIESEDEVINTILTLAKEASIKTDEVVGDGTTTTLVLLSGIFNEGLKLVKNGKNPLLLKYELDDALKYVVNEIKKNSKKPTKKDLYNIAFVSSNNSVIGKNISNAFSKVKIKNAIEIKEHDENYTILNYNNGYYIDSDLGSDYYFNIKKECILDNACILLVDNVIYDIKSLSSILNYVIDNNKSLVIVANDYSDDVKNELINLYLEEKVNVIMFKNPMYGGKSKLLLDDLSIISDAKIVRNRYTIQDLGTVKSALINKDFTLFKYNNNKNITQYRKTICNNENDDFYNKRIAGLSNGYVDILVGATTHTERREKKMRYIDALEAVNSSQSGIVPGGGTLFIKISNKMYEVNDGYKVIKKSLLLPFKQILINSLNDYDSIYKVIKDSDFSLVYNVKTNEFDNIKNTSVVDPTQVLINSISNACSIASMLLSTSSLVINEVKNNLNINRDFNEL